MHRSVTKTNLRQHNKISLGPLESLGEAASGKVECRIFCAFRTIDWPSEPDICSWMKAQSKAPRAVFGNDLKIMIANDFRSKRDTFAVHTVGKILKLRLLSLYMDLDDDASRRLCSTATLPSPIVAKTGPIRYIRQLGLNCSAGPSGPSEPSTQTRGHGSFTRLFIRKSFARESDNCSHFFLMRLRNLRRHFASL